MTPAIRIPLLLLLLTMILPAGPQAAGDRQQERERFLAAEKALKGGLLAQYRELKASLKDYPLHPYLEFQELKQNLAKVDHSRVDDFLKTHADTPLAGRLRYSWLNQLAKRQEWAEYVRYYQPEKSPRRRCLYLRALIETGRSRTAWKGTESLWLSGRSRPDECDPVFDAWREAGGLKPELVWQRIDLAMAAGQTRLARYLGRFLPADDQAWVNRWLKIHGQPRGIREPSGFSREHPYREAILLHGLKQLARSDVDRAWDVWKKLAVDYPFDPEQRYQAERALALAMIRSNHPSLLPRLDQVTPQNGDTRLQEARIRAALARQEWDYVEKWIGILPETRRKTERWRYWYARALEAEGKMKQADAVYHELAEERSYFGFLAADRVGLAYRLNDNPLEITTQQTTALARKPGVRRAEELFALGRFIDARREWRYATRNLNDAGLQTAAKLAQHWGWNDQAIFTLARARYWDDLNLRFPLEHRKTIDRESEKRQMDNAWIFAVVRQESAFASDAISPAGAMGLMQLMPRTAKSIARRIKRRSPGRRALLTPETNIELGTAYLQRVFKQLDDHPVLATAAYNAGPHRVRKWLPDEVLPADLWVEGIPFRETRTYTQRVLAYSIIYDQRLGRPGSHLQQRMSPIKGKNRS
jgi:soluble lytic murein transglycosylase